MDSWIKLGVVGLRRGRSLLGDALLLPYVRVAAICDRDPVRREDTRKWLTDVKGLKDFQVLCAFEEILDTDCDAVIIATDADLHVPMSIKALEAGKHVLSEVPAIRSPEEARQLKAAVLCSGKQYMLAENCCFWGFIATWKAIIDQNRLGRIWLGEAEYLHNVEALMVDAEGKPTWRASYDAIRYLTHDLGPLLMLMDDCCVEASGFAPEYNPIAGRSTGTPNEMAVFKTRKGALIRILVSFGLQLEPARHNFALYGADGTLQTTRTGKYETLAYFRDVPHTHDLIRIPTDLSYPGASAATLGGHGGADFPMMKAFIDSLINGTQPPIDVDLAIRMSLPGVYAHESFRQGGVPLRIPDPADLMADPPCVQTAWQDETRRREVSRGYISDSDA